MRLNLLLVGLFGFGALTTTGCDLLKRGQDKKDETQASSSSTTSGATKLGDTTAATDTAAAAKPATTGCTWPDGDPDHDITITKGCSTTAKNSITVRDGHSFTIEEGVKIAFETDVFFWIEYGKLVVKGTDAQPVTFTSANKSPAAGDWVGIGFREKTMSGTSIEHLIIEYAGSKASSGQGAFQVENLRQGGRISLSGSTFRSSAQYGLVAGENATFAKFENNTFKDNTSGAMNVHAEVLGSVGRGNTFAQPIHVAQSDVNQTTTWPPFDVPVLVDGVIAVFSDNSVPALTIADKTTVKMGQDTYITIANRGAGALVAKNVTFTSNSPSPSPGDWSGIFLYAKSGTTDIEGCTFEYFGSSGGSAGGAITLWGTSAKDLHNVTVQNNVFRKGKQQAMHSDDHTCAPYDKSNKVEGLPFCNKD
jgi:hypothetical protein